MPALKYLSPDLPRPIYDDAYAILEHASGSGELIGSFCDLPIYEQMIDRFGRVYSYVGLAPRRRDGSFDAEAMEPGEFVLPPGLLYVCEQSREKSESTGSSNQMSLI